jgi:hypothetical protein
MNRMDSIIQGGEKDAELLSGIAKTYIYGIAWKQC